MINNSSENFNAPLALVVFGATGDLYQQKLASALFNLFMDGLLPADFSVIGFARRPLSSADFQAFTREAILKNKLNKKTAVEDNKDIKNNFEEKLSIFLEHFSYQQGDLENAESFMNLSKYLGMRDQEKAICTNKLFYLAVPPTFYGGIFQNISKAGLTLPCAPGVADVASAWTRVLVEKPFGKDMLEAEKLDRMLGELFDESQIFRIDHYLAKEAVQNILNFRFSHGIFEPLWSAAKIEKMCIIFYEQDVVSKRGAFYDDIGALRDVGQNHMLQLLALMTMEKSEQMNSDEIHKARQAILEKTKLQNVLVRGQYEGYLSEPEVNPNSTTETFFRVNLAVETPRWDGVTFELTSGKALQKSEVLIKIYFKNINAHLTFSISSNQGVTHDAYEKVLYDGILGDQTLFVSTSEIMSEWKLVTDIINKWQAMPLVVYKKGIVGEDIK